MPRAPLPFLVSTLCALLVSGCNDPTHTIQQASANDQSNDRPNVILISVDTLRKDHLSAYGYDKPTSPNISRLGSSGIAFESAYAPMPVTGPSHTTMLTGLYPVTHRVERNGVALGNSFTTIAEHLLDAGYETHAVVSSFVLDAKFGLAQGFESYDDDFPITDVMMGRRTFEGHKLEDDAGFDQRADRATDKAISVLNSAVETEEPFFLFVHYMDPHAPYTPPQPYKSEFAPGGTEPTMLENIIGDYDAEIAFTDHEIGRLLARVDELGLQKETLVIFTADHGEGLMDHGLLGHGFTLYENEVNVPLIFSWPGTLPRGVIIDEPVELLDIAPTILALVQHSPETNAFSGISLKGALLGSRILAADRDVYLHRRWYDGSPNEPAFFPPYDVLKKDRQTFAMKGRKYGIRRADWKYIQAGKDGVNEIYDLRTDPRETENLADTHADRIRALNDRIEQWLNTYKLKPGEDLPELMPEDIEALEALGYTQ